MAVGMMRIRRYIQWGQLSLRNALLVPRLKRKLSVHAFPRAYTVVYAVDCSPEEQGESAAIKEAELLRLCRGMEVYCGNYVQFARIRVLCIGRNARVDRAPAWIQGWLNEPFGGGVWLRELNAALVFFQDNVPIRRIVLHELSHALLDRLTNGFPYPIAIQEGFARRAEYFVPSESGVSEWQRSSEAGAQAIRCLESRTGWMSIKDLLLFDAHLHWRRDMSAFARMTGWAFWLNLYLETLGSEASVLKAILPQLRKCNVQTPIGVYEWLQEATGMSETALESAFLEFCNERADELPPTEASG